MQNEKVSANDLAARELKITRTLNAPVSLVWEVWTKPEHIKNWWGPNGFTNTIHLMEVKPKGEWEFIMHGPDGTDYKNKNVFMEVVQHKKIVYDHVTAPIHRATITFEEQGSKTILTFQMVFETAEVKEQIVKTFKADSGLQQTVTHLEEYLSAILSSKN
jgi:uncharacterized protein YndB with AHSA1/START domain